MSIHAAREGAHESPQLVTRVLRALDTTEHAVRAVLSGDAGTLLDAPGPVGGGLPATPTGPLPLQRDKVLGEAALLLRACRHLVADDLRLRGAHDRLLRLIAPHCRPADLLTALCTDPGHVWELAYSHVLVRAAGSPAEDVDAVLAACLDAPPGAEQPAHVQAERAWLEGIWRDDGSGVAAELLAHSCLARPLDAFAATTQEGYEFTHLILHATDLGTRSVPLPREAAEIAADAETALAAALDADNFDLAAELLWTWPMLALPWSPTALFALRVLDEVVDEYDFLPGPGYRAAEHRVLPVGERAAYLLRTSYHATLVLGVLSAAMLLPGRPPAAPPPVTAAVDVADDVVALLPRVPAPPRWVHAYNGLGPQRRGSLTAFVLAVGLRRAGRGHDLAALRGLLAAALQLGRTDSPSVHQASGLLRRSAQLARTHTATRTRSHAV